ncbi:MAG: aldo/keto reductase family protein [candidate division Zixibacteria bacterium]|nr:aldo/keto reductase family protein [candidate division Zixibacteria bacterium]
MHYRRVGKSGLKISDISLGAWLTYGGTVEDKTATKIVQRAIELGVNFIDIADIYRKGAAETVVGNAIKEFNRTDLVISSKLFWPMTENINDRGLSRKHIFESIEKTLKRIGTDYLDIYFCHRSDPETEIEETARAMDDLMRQGKVLYWGTSVWEAYQIERAVGVAERYLAYRPAVEQPRYNMIDRHIENDILPTCRAHGIGLTVWSPLAQGLLTGKYNSGLPEGSRGATSQWLERDINETNVAKVRGLSEIAQRLGLTVGQLALAWILRLPDISCAITGATTIAQLEENVKASGVRLDAATLAEIDLILDN